MSELRAPANAPGIDPTESATGRVPALALALGGAGLLPFVAGAALIWLVDGDARFYAALATAAYAATILGFLGGIHWGLAFRHPRPPARLLVWGVLPSLVAWGVLLMEPGAGLALAGAMLLVCYAVDRRLYREEGVGQWLLLRFRLSAVASLSCFIGAAGS